jgi:hypothetical protein
VSAPAAPAKAVWLFDRRTDLAVFLGSALASGAFVLAAPALGISPVTPLWAWLLFVVCIDVAHVWSTLFRTYLDPAERARYPLRYVGVPLAAWLIGVLVHYQLGGAIFWRLLAYLALWHFVRQQVGWMALYGRRAGAGPGMRRLDAAAIYAATLGPALWWHANLPRPFWWFVEGDFLALPAWVGPLALGAHALVLAVWMGVTLYRRIALKVALQPGSWALLLATWIAWYGGIVWAQSDLAFTVMNVTLHGVPYLVFLFRYARGRAAETDEVHVSWRGMGVGAFVGLLLVLAFAEEFLWDTFVWRERPEVFGDAGIELGAVALSIIVPLLALPQVTHYVLDAMVWRTSREPRLLSRLGWGKASAAPPVAPEVVAPERMAG